MIPLPAGNSSSQFLFQKAATIIGFCVSFHKYLYESVVPISVVYYTWVLWLNTSETLTYLLLWRLPMVSPVVRIQGHLSALPYPTTSRAGTLLGFLLPSALLLAPSRLLTSERHTTGCILELFPAYTHTLDDLIRLYHPYTDNSLILYSSLSHALNPRFLIRLPAWITIRCLTNDSNGNCPKWNSWLKPLPRHLLPSSPFQLHFFSSYSDPKPQTSMSSFCSQISYPTQEKIPLTLPSSNIWPILTIFAATWVWATISHYLDYCNSTWLVLLSCSLAPAQSLLHTAAE